jgi:uncharacterized protein (DUF1330 family)
VAAYLIGQVIVHDMERFAPYVERTTALIVEYGGEVLDVVQAVEAVEGDWPMGALTALVRFPDEKALRAFWNSPGNEAMKDLRHASATSNVALCLWVAKSHRPAFSTSSAPVFAALIARLRPQLVGPRLTRKGWVNHLRQVVDSPGKWDFARDRLCVNGRKIEPGMNAHFTRYATADWRLDEISAEHSGQTSQ